MTDEAWIDTVRLARDLGDVSQLLPPGVETLRDMPHPVFSATRQALIFLSFEELPEDETPRKSIWNDGEALKEHFDRVKVDRKRKYGGDSSSDIEDPVQNEAARALIVD